MSPERKFIIIAVTVFACEISWHRYSKLKMCHQECQQKQLENCESDGTTNNGESNSATLEEALNSCPPEIAHTKSTHDVHVHSVNTSPSTEQKVEREENLAEEAIDRNPFCFGFRHLDFPASDKNEHYTYRFTIAAKLVEPRLTCSGEKHLFIVVNCPFAAHAHRQAVCTIES